MNKKGFTLIELLGSIVILASIALFAFPAILNLLSSSQKDVDDSMKDYAIGATREYVNDNVNIFIRDGSTKKVRIETLVNEGYISDTTINSEKNAQMLNDCVNVTGDSKKYNYTYNPGCS